MPKRAPISTTSGPSRPARRAAFRLLALALGALVSPGLAAQNVAATEQAVKAAFLYKFLSYVEFPPAVLGAVKSPLVIGVLGADDIAAELVRVSAGRLIDNRAIEVRILKEGDPLQGLQVLFAALPDAARLGRLLRQAQQRSMLAVTDGEGTLDLGSVINFRLIDGRVRFEVSLANAERNGLRLSSRMVAVAWRVERGMQ